MSEIRLLAPARLSLYLHLTSLAREGVHHFESCVTFCDLGDEIHLRPSPAFVFRLEGPMALSLKGQDLDKNMAVQAVKLLATRLGRELDCSLTLVKNLPLAAGLSGAVSDAAASLRALAQHWGIPLDNPTLLATAQELGPDVPHHLKGQPGFYRSDAPFIPLENLPPAYLVLANPGLALATSSLCRSWKGSYGESGAFHEVPQTVEDLAFVLSQRRNDLTDTALQLLPEIRQALLALAASGDCLLARMAGSGPTCFGLYETRGAARNAAARLFAAHPDWWIVPACMGQLSKKS